MFLFSFYLLCDTYRIAVVLPKAKSFLRYGNQLMGYHAFKRRHLEIMGYKVAFINLRDWWLLASNKNRVEYVKGIIWSDRPENYAATNDR